MKNAILLLFLILGVTACNRPWTDKDKQEFTSGCVSRSAAELGDSLSRVYCHCLLQKVVDKYPNANDAGYIKYDTAVAQISRECRRTIAK